MQVRTYNRMNALNKLELVEKFIVIDASNTEPLMWADALQMQLEATSVCRDAL